MKANCLIDWLTFTVFNYGNRYNDVINDILGMDYHLFRHIGRGRYGYKNSVEYNNIVVYYDARDEAGGDAGNRGMGVCVSMSGNGCRIYEEYKEKYTLMHLCRKLIKMKERDEKSINITRCDIAADDMSGNLDLLKIMDYLKERKVNTRLRKVNVFNGFDLGSKKEDEAVGFYIGSEESEFRYRFYDKAKEQGDMTGDWKRVEMVHHGKYAENAVRELIDNYDDVGVCVAGMIRNTLLFIELDNKRVERCSVAEWWDDFLETIEKVAVMRKKKAKQSAEKIYNLFVNQLCRCFSMASEMFGNEFWEVVKNEGNKKMNNQQRAIIEDFKRGLRKNEEFEKFQAVS